MNNNANVFEKSPGEYCLLAVGRSFKVVGCRAGLFELRTEQDVQSGVNESIIDYTRVRVCVKEGLATVVVSSSFTLLPSG